MKNIFIAILFFYTILPAQNEITNFLVGPLNDTEKLLEGYMSPLGAWFGSGLNAGWYNTARPHTFPGFDVTGGVHFITPSEEAMSFKPILTVHNILLFFWSACYTLPAIILILTSCSWMTAELFTSIQSSFQDQATRHCICCKGMEVAWYARQACLGAFAARRFVPGGMAATVLLRSRRQADEARGATGCPQVALNMALKVALKVKAMSLRNMT